MKINSKEDLLKSLHIKKIMTIERYKKSGTFKDNKLYEGHWNIIESELKSGIRKGDNMLQLLDVLDELKGNHKNDFIRKFKDAHERQDYLKGLIK